MQQILAQRVTDQTQYQESYRFITEWIYKKHPDQQSTEWTDLHSGSDKWNFRKVRIWVTLLFFKMLCRSVRRFTDDIPPRAFAHIATPVGHKHRIFTQRYSGGKHMRLARHCVIFYDNTLNGTLGMLSKVTEKNSELIRQKQKILMFFLFRSACGRRSDYVSFRWSDWWAVKILWYVRIFTVLLAAEEYRRAESSLPAEKMLSPNESFV